MRVSKTEEPCAGKLHAGICEGSVGNWRFYLDYMMKLAGTYSIQISSLSGRVIGELHSGNLIAGEHSFNLNGISAAAGIYLVQVKGATNGVARVMLR